MKQSVFSGYFLLSLGLVLALTRCASATGQTNPAGADSIVQSNLEPPALIEEGLVASYYRLELGGDTALDYAVVLPDNYDPTQNYPVLLALSPGPQTKDMVATSLGNFWAEEARRRGWIVISPIAPNSTLFFQGSERLIPQFLARMSEQYRPEGDRFHLAGLSNGGISAFRIALNCPELFHSLVAFPGFPATDEELQQLDRLRDIPVALFVGQNDNLSWISRMEETAAILSSHGGRVTLDVVPDEGHVISGLAGGQQLYDLLDTYR